MDPLDRSDTHYKGFRKSSPATSTELFVSLARTFILQAEPKLIFDVDLYALQAPHPIHSIFLSRPLTKI